MNKYHARFADGPLAGRTLNPAAAPIMLRVATRLAGEARALLRGGDPPLADETVVLYMMHGEPSTGFWDGRDPVTRRRTGGAMVMPTYRLANNPPATDILRSEPKWVEWCVANEARLMGEFEASKRKPAEAAVAAGGAQ